MAHLVALDGRAAPDSGALEALYWWRRAAPQAAASDLPGNRLRELAARRRQDGNEAAAVRSAAADAEAIVALRAERREAAFATATGVVATLAPAAAIVYSVVDRHPIALGFALAGLCAALAALVQAVRWFVALRSTAPPAPPPTEA